MFLAKAGNGLADLRSIFQPVGAQAELPEAREGTAFDIPNAEFVLVFLCCRFRIDTPPTWKILADQDDADGTPDIGDTVGQCDHASCFLRLHARRQLDDT